MKSKPILFSTPMVQAILEGRKTQTRRVCKIPIKPMEEVMCTEETDPNDPEFSGFYLVKNNWVYHTESKLAKSLSPFGQIGDLLWVRETFRPKGHSFPIGKHFEYKATAEADGNPINEPWKPSIFMPKDAARIWLKITNIKVERLNDISDEDAKNEGIKLSEHSSENVDLWYRYDDGSYTFLPQTSFRTLWESINGKNSWNSNPWVWVIEFERIEKPSEV
jgi:hypothetical protein